MLDIVQNAVKAEATLIEIDIAQSVQEDTLCITVKDNGKGMTPEFLKTVTDPFSTTRTTRRVGLGIPLFKEAAEAAGGSFDIESAPGAGTRVCAVFGYSHIDRQPIGDMASTLLSVVQCNPDIEFVYHHSSDLGGFDFDTRQIKKILAGVPITSPDVAVWMRDYLNENIEKLYGGAQ